MFFEIADVNKSIECLEDLTYNSHNDVKDEYKQFTLEDARQLENDVDKKTQALSESNGFDDEKEAEDSGVNASQLLAGNRVEKEGFFSIICQTIKSLQDGTFWAN